MTITEVQPAPYKLVDTQYTSEGSCIDCGMKIGVGYRWYKNLQTKEEVSTRFRSACDCWADSDPYAQYAKPMMRWSNPGNPDGEWLYPHWNDEAKKWDMLPNE